MEKHLVKKPVANVFKGTHKRRNANNFAVGLRRKKLTQSERTLTATQISDDQVTKGAGWMPWHWTPKKDVVSCDKLRGAASRH